MTNERFRRFFFNPAETKEKEDKCIKLFLLIKTSDSRIMTVDINNRFNYYIKFKRCVRRNIWSSVCEYNSERNP